MIRRAGARSSSASAAARNRAAEPTADIAAVFRSCDADGNGTISREELEQVLRALDPGIWDDRKITTLFEEIDASGNKEIEYDEFVNWAMAGSQVARGLMRNGAQGNQGAAAPEAASEPVGRRRTQRSPMNRSAPTLPAEEPKSRRGSPARQSPSPRAASPRAASPKTASPSAAGDRGRSGGRSPSPSAPAEYGSRIAKMVHIFCQKNAPTGEADWTRMNTGDENGAWYHLNELKDQLAEATEWQLLGGLPVLPAEHAFMVNIGHPVLPPATTSREEGWVSCSTHNATGEVEEGVCQLRVMVVAQMQEIGNKGLLRLFGQTSLAPVNYQVWWRVAPGNNDEGFRADEPLDVVIQSLDIDEVAPDGPMPELPDFLMGHQRKSVRWMAAREQSAEPFIADWYAKRSLNWTFAEDNVTAPKKEEAGKGKEDEQRKNRGRASLGRGPVPLQLEYRMENIYEILGGVLADPVGSGKTATCLSHVALAHGAPMPPAGDWQRSYLVELDATLILCPENVHHQWLAEIEKWEELREALDAFPVYDVATLVKTKLKGSTRTKACVVVAPYSIFQGEEYKKKLASPLSTKPDVWKRKVASSIAQAINGDGQRGLALEAYRWRRVILDEFHELAGLGCRFYAATQVLRFLQSAIRWGVTGTPEELLRSTGSAQRAAKIFHCELNARRSAQRFCEQYYRGSRLELDVRVEHRTVPVRHWGTEAAIYQQYVRDLGVNPASPDWARPWSVEALGKVRQLLQFCSHFSADDAPAMMQTAKNPADAAVALYKHKCAAVTKALLEVESTTMPYEEVLMEDEDLRLPRLQRCIRTFVYESKKKALENTLEENRDLLRQAHEKARDAQRSLQYFDAVWQLATRGNREVECPICFDDFAITDMGLLHCAHTFCLNCIQGAMGAGRTRSAGARCPICRGPLNAGTFVSVQHLRDAFGQTEARQQEESGTRTGWSKYGSKLKGIVETLHQVHGEDETDKVIVFCQWRNLEVKISESLTEFGIPHLRLSPDIDLFERRRVLETFQDPDNTESRVLMLSLDGHASGTNLTCASHVFFVHPMVAATGEQQLAYERQAIGRAARLGQRKTVTVWRFLTTGTVEEHVAGAIA